MWRRKPPPSSLHSQQPGFPKNPHPTARQFFPKEDTMSWKSYRLFTLFMVIMAMLSDYVSGNIAVAWKRGNPIYVRVTKDATSK
jgi:hypothetical protein